MINSHIFVLKTVQGQTANPASLIRYQTCNQIFAKPRTWQINEIVVRNLSTETRKPLSRGIATTRS